MARLLEDEVQTIAARGGTSMTFKVSIIESLIPVEFNDFVRWQLAVAAPRINKERPVQRQTNTSAWKFPVLNR